MLLKKIIIPFFISFIVTSLYAQNDKQQLASTSIMDTSIKIKTDTAIVAKDSVPVKDTLLKKKHDPAKATRRSAIIPGWGQAYNRQYWKIPLVYAALGITAGTYVYNDKWYKRTRDAYSIVINGDTANYDQIDPKLKGLVDYPQSLQFYRNDFRKNRDYSVLFFLLAWGLNVVDATVFGHLKDFDVSDDLSMHIKPTYNFSTKTPGLGVAFNLKNPQRKVLPAF
ncbi:hypothetical protein FRZ67_08775 [Panacibacter ginsenosidivorans]|uniref:DUF5683 domain-containing protein n=1 Tax=Panacibacter ginsenosidivorans TaxID=1813871 RepID=A0A5B8V890_9BACT|nr:DUF5683 domain-containing protein [Panacibacter ginsenosidivorans]QEC67385.1 hypothetical protein FRZ67_08775 [Panacibacter ginsenosidivorans]